MSEPATTTAAVPTAKPYKIRPRVWARSTLYPIRLQEADIDTLAAEIAELRYKARLFDQLEEAIIKVAKGAGYTPNPDSGAQAWQCLGFLGARADICNTYSSLLPRPVTGEAL